MAVSRASGEYPNIMYSLDLSILVVIEQNNPCPWRRCRVRVTRRRFCVFRKQSRWGCEDQSKRRAHDLFDVLPHPVDSTPSTQYQVNKLFSAFSFKLICLTAYWMKALPWWSESVLNFTKTVADQLGNREEGRLPLLWRIHVHNSPMPNPLTCLHSVRTVSAAALS